MKAVTNQDRVIWTAILIILFGSVLIIRFNFELTKLVASSNGSGAVPNIVQGSSKTTQTSSENAKVTSDLSSDNSTAFKRTSYASPDVIYGHVHMAKTAGTYLNGFLANNFDGVCGHKGYSYDAFQANVRFRKKPYNINTGYGRDRISPHTMQQIGFEDCDYISSEHSHEFWFQFNDFHDTPMELHVPCRDPIDHLMSQCNHRKIVIDCHNVTDDDALEKAIEPCLVQMYRFDGKLDELENIYLKCYDFQYQFTTYMDYLSGNLRPRRFISDYVRRETNRKRKKENECIWKDEGLMKRVENLLNKVDYYKFCKQCLKSDNDITREDA